MSCHSTTRANAPITQALAADGLVLNGRAWHTARAQGKELVQQGLWGDGQRKICLATMLRALPSADRSTLECLSQLPNTSLFAFASFVQKQRRCVCGAWLPANGACRNPRCSLLASPSLGAPPSHSRPDLIKLLERAVPELGPMLTAVADAGGRTLVVGGAVRDGLRGNVGKDVDLEVYGLDADSLTRILEKFGRLDAVGVAFGILKMTTPMGQDLDWALPRSDSKAGGGHRGFITTPDPKLSILEALHRRDFTINSMALDPRSGELWDPFNGQADLATGTLRATSPAFAEDPLRVLRGMQFAARWDMRLSPDTEELARSLQTEFTTLAAERVWGEWGKLLRSPTPSAGIRVLVNTGWDPCFPSWPLTDPQIGSCLDRAATACTTLPPDPDLREAIALATICSKLPTATARTALREIGCPPTLSRWVLALAKPLPLRPLSVGAVLELSKEVAPGTIRQWSVVQTALGRPQPQWARLALEQGCAASSAPPLVVGSDLIQMGVTPGPQFGSLLKSAWDAQVADVTTASGRPQRSLALAWLRGRCSGPADTAAAWAQTSDARRCADSPTAWVQELTRIHSELADCAGIPQDSRYHPEGSVLTHTCYAVERAVEIAARHGLGSEESAVLEWAVLCHDLGKVSTTVETAGGGIISPGHAQEGVLPTLQMLARAGCPPSIAALVIPLVREHMAHVGAQPTPHVLGRLQRRLAPASLALWEMVVEADHSGRPPLPGGRPGLPWLQAARPLSPPPKKPAWLNGADLIAAGWVPGPEFRIMLKAAQEAEDRGEINDQAQAQAWLNAAESTHSNHFS